MFVSQMNIHEFRGIKNCDEPLEFSDFTVLIGRNNSGKSSVLEALSLLPFPSDWHLPYYNDTRINLLTRIHGGQSSMIYAYSGTATIDYIISNKAWKVTLRDNGRVSLDIEGIGPTQTRANVVASVAKALGLQMSTSVSEDINRKVFFIPSNTSFMDAILQAMASDQNRYFIMKTGAHTRVTRELINKCVDDRYTEILFAPELSARKELPDSNVLYIKIKDLGDGIEKVVLLVLWLEALNPALILWDDFEGSAHPTLIKSLLNWLCKKKKWQVVLSTHSIDVLSSLLDVKPKNAKVIQLKKTAGDILIHEYIELEDLENLIDANQDPRILVDRLSL